MDEFIEKYTVQYSIDNGGAVSDWPEYCKTVKGKDIKSAKENFIKLNQDKGCFLILDIFQR